MNLDLIILKEDSFEEYKRKIKQNSKEHGWTDRERSIDEIICLIQSEIYEMFEEFRKDEPKEVYFSNSYPEWISEYAYNENDINCIDLRQEIIQNSKPEGFVIEMADIIIRLLDAEEIIIKHLGLEISSIFNFDLIKKNRPFLEKDLFQNIRRMTALLEHEQFEKLFYFCFEFIREQDFKTSLLQAIRIKHKYNLTRPYRHGNKRF